MPREISIQEMQNWYYVILVDRATQSQISPALRFTANEKIYTLLRPVPVPISTAAQQAAM